MQSKKHSMPSQSMHTGPSLVKNEKSFTKRQPLTHFLSLPIGHHPALHDIWGRTSIAFLQSSPAIPGLHESIMLKPGSLHLTLGVLSLVSYDQPSGHTHPGPTAPETPGDSKNTTSPPRRHSVDEALQLLQTLKTPIKNILTDHGSLKVPLEYVDIMRSRPNQNLNDSHVMWAGPDLDNGAGRLLERVCNLVHSTFKSAGMLQDDRPLKLHCTLINTLYRKENTTYQKDGRRKNKKRTPFSFSALLSSSAFKQIAVQGAPETVQPNSGPYKVKLGTWTVDEVQLCEMGSKDAAGVYKSIGSISLC